jgi:hypothetical protein
MVVFIVGPSKAGKTQATKTLAADASQMCPFEVVRFDLDEELGPANRGFADRAIECCATASGLSGPNRIVLVDVGAGQLVSSTFRHFLCNSLAYPVRTVVVDCGEETFRERHGDNAPNEVTRYYGPNSLEYIWREAQRSGRYVDTHGPYNPSEWARHLAFFLMRVKSQAA